tara:strand:- start:1574 stop:2830 length:1257 start_codon:yes stop_codon:yes gene_type:complete
MKKYIYTILFLILLFVIILVGFKEFRIYILKPIRVEKAGIIKSLNTPYIKLHIPKLTQNKFDLIYSKYPYGSSIEQYKTEQYEDFVKYLNENNQWEKAKLEYLDKTYNILVKIHGKTPSQHVENKHYSLGVKVLDNKKINGVSRFNLIVYWRIRYNSDIIKYLSEKLDIYFKGNILTKVQVNNKPLKLYFFEFRADKDYFSKTNLIALKYKSDHSLIYTGGDLAPWDKKLKKSIKKMNLNDSLKELIYEKYSSLNKAIFDGDTKKTLSYFDIDYLAKIQAFRYLFGDNGHGFADDNLLAAFNTRNHKFYPFVHRDNSPHNFSGPPKIDGKFSGSDIIGIASPLFRTISESKLLAEKTKNYLTKILKSNIIKISDIDSIIQTHNSYYYSSDLKQILNFQPDHQSTINIRKLISNFKNTN